MNKKLPYSANKNFKTAINSFSLLSLFIFLSSIGYSQCAKLLDGNSAASNKPIWTHCDGSAYTLYIQTNQSTGAYTINWGDGDTSAGASLNPPSTISHKYPASRKNYSITFTETDSACTVTGLLVIERPVNASITRPLGAGGGMNICAPGVLDFINTSTDVSVNTTFRWNFGDGSPIITKAYTDSGKTNSHTFQKAMVCRNATVRLEAENYCTSVPSFAAVGPISIYDKDKAVISTSGTFLCYPDTELTVINSSILNCRPQGNTTQRYEYWNFGNYWGQGADSLKGWIQFSNPPSLSQPIAFPGKGSYTITLYDSSLCGVDTANSTIVIGDSPVAVFSSSADTVCAGGRIRFFNNSTGGANISRWNFGDGIWRSSGMWSRTHTFNTPGLYTIELAVFNTSGSGACTDTISKQIFVSELPTADFLINPTDGCDSVEITITENSRKAVQWNWDFGDGTNDTVSNPPKHKYKSIGNFDIKLMVTHSNGCSNNITKSIDVYGSPIVDFTPKKVCEGSIGFFRDNSISPGGDPFTSWTWDFGDGTFSSSQNNSHVYDTSGTYSLILTVTTAYCTTIDSFDLVVHPRPVAAFSVSDSLSCQPHSLNVSNNSTGANGYYWDFGNGDTSYTKSAFFPYVFSHNNANSTNFTLQLIAESQEGCFDTASKTIVTYPKIHADFGINDSIGCSPFYVNYSNISSGAQFYQWYFGDGDSSTVYNPKHFYQNSTSNKLNFTTTLIAKSSFGCYDTATTSVQIQPKPSAIFTTTDSVSCSPLVTYFTNNSLNSTNYFWNFGDGGTSTQTSPAHTFTNSTGATVGYKITLIASTAFGCSDTTSDSVYVYHVPNSGFKTNAMPQCAPISVAFTNVSSGGIGQKWFFGDGDTASTPSNPTHTYKNQTLFIKNYTSKLLVTSSNGCTDTSQQVIVVYPEPIFTFQTNPDSGCSPLKVVFPSAIGAVDYKWYFGDGDSAKGSTPTHVYSNSTTNSLNFTTTLIAKSSFGCSDTNTGSIIVHPSPSAAISVSDSINCQPHSLNISNNSTGAYRYHWDFGNGDTSDTNASLFPYAYTHNNPTSTNFKLQLVVETQNGCFDTSFKIIKTYPQIHALYSMNDSVGCTPFRVTFTNNSTGQQFNAWTFGDGSSSINASPSHTYINSRLTDTLFYPKFLVTSQFGCRDSILDTIKVHPKPIANFSKNKTNGCHPLPVGLINTSSIADTNFWFFGDGTTLFTNNSNVNHTYTNLGTSSILRTIELRVATQFGCKDTVTQTVDVYPEIISDFSLSDTSGCTDLTVNFTNKSKGAQFFKWQFGDGDTSSSKNSSHTYINSRLTDTLFYPKFLVTSQFGCRDSILDTIKVHPKPISIFNTSSLRGCQPLNLTFTNQSVLNSNSIWNFGDRDTSLSNGNTVHTYTHNDIVSRTFTAQLIAESNKGCRDTSSKQLEVFPKISVNFDISDTSGCTEHEVVFKNASSGANQYDWNFGDGNTDRASDPRHTFVNADTVNRQFTIRLKVSSVYGCEDSVFKTVTVFPQPKAIFVATPANQKYPDATVVFSNNSSTGPWNYSWDFGDSITSAVKFPNDKYYETWGEYKITLIATNPNCADTMSQTIKIEPPRAVLDFEASGVGCSPLVVTVKNRSIFGKQFIWNFGDGGISNLENPAPYIYNRPGVYTISLNVIGEDNDVVLETKKDCVVVRAAASASFDYRPNEVNVPNDPLILFNLSDDSDKWLWNLGDGTTYTDQNPEHNYQEAGIYTITLIADNEFGCADTFSVESAVTAISSGSLKFPTAFIPNIGGSSGGNYDPKTLDNSIFFPIFEGVVDYHLLIFNRWGEIVFESKDVLIGWDGYYRGTETMCAQDVYIWKVTGKYVNGKTFDEAGEVTLLK